MASAGRFSSLTKALESAHKELSSLKQDETFLNELAFFLELKKLRLKYQFSNRDVIRLLEPGRRFSEFKSADELLDAVSAASQPDYPGPEVGQGKRRIMRYRNPHTDEVIDTRGANHKLLKAWKGKYGARQVETWRIEQN
ncbi:histone-like nucleoid-structuring protein, MvaT/MvaU family [Pseudomonas fluorescens]|uniref:histone-like nucleoid-structuring protein, MvaT/MvaU family n=1 Tax=Pseudomonas fluorescens TaxID=294 RepID=UPI0037F221BC